ncbi:phosphoribosyl transferase [Patescibacteria group bacterium]|nr:MAG: phosphoribosyl transferase [Patescibacteria group bacterium]
MLTMIFRNRIEAGQRLAESLKDYREFKDTLVVALPRGGVVVGREVARALGLPLDIVVPRKIASPESPEYALGALAEDGEVVWGPEGRPEASWVERVIDEERREAARRLKLYRQKLPPRIFNGKNLIVVDDGVATGLTMAAALKTLRKEGPRRLILAVPHGARDSLQKLESLADETVVLETPIFYASVGSFYEEFPQIEDEEVIKLLNEKL